MLCPYFYPLIDDYERSLIQWSPLVNAGLNRHLPIDPVFWPGFSDFGLSVDVLRADLIHPIISGNKWFKLKYLLAHARHMSINTLVSVGGAWSNHLHALAYCSHLLGFRSEGYVRGEELDPYANAMLTEAAEWGMELHFVARREYRALCESISNGTLVLKEGYMAIPEGGDSWLGVAGTATMVKQTQQPLTDYSLVVCAVGTGCTFAGLRLGLQKHARLLGISALKGRWQQQQMSARLRRCAQDAFLSNSDLSFGPWEITDQYCDGGFGKQSEALTRFISQFQQYSGISIEPVYSGKVFFALNEMAKQGKLTNHNRILVIHGGGLQGQRGFAG